MTRRFWATACLVATALCALKTNAEVGTTDQNLDYVPGEVLVEFYDEPAAREFIANDNRFNDVIKAYGNVSISESLSVQGKTFKKRKFRRLKFQRKANLNDIVEKLKRSPRVKSVSVNALLQVDETPNDPYFSSSRSWNQSYDDLWALKRLSAENAWNITTGDPDLIIAVIDTGVDVYHEDLQENIALNETELAGAIGVDDDGNGYVDDVNGYDFVNGDNDPMDDNGHGTHVAGTIAAVGNNALGITGVLWQAQILPVKACNQSGTCSSLSISRAIVYAVDQGAKIINMSLGGSGNATMKAAIEYAYQKGVVILAAAGNSRANLPFYYPASYPEVFSVGSSSYKDTRSSFSNFGMEVDFLAPGGGYDESDEGSASNILSLRASQGFSSSSSQTVGENYFRLAGTSMATPHAAGVAGLLLSADPSLSVEEVRQRMRLGADDIGETNWDERTSFGRLNAEHALTLDSTCEALITFPLNQMVMRQDHLDVIGSAAGSDFSSYTIEISKNVNHPQWKEITVSPIPQIQSILTTLTTESLSGSYRLRLRVYDSHHVLCGEDHKAFTFSQGKVSASLVNDSGDSRLFGFVLARGDINQDGKDDVLIGSPGCEDTTCKSVLNSGQVYLVFGDDNDFGTNVSITQTSQIAHTWESSADADRLGISVAFLDIDGDSLDDIALGLPGDAQNGSNAGEVCLFLAKNQEQWARNLTPAQADLCFWGENISDKLGRFVENARDVDGDGRDDLITSACGQDQAGTNYGKVYILYGADIENALATQTPTHSITSASTQLTGVNTLTADCSTSTFGSGLSVNTAGDFNQDGFDDIIVGNRLHNSGAGAVFLFYGRAAKITSGSLANADAMIRNDKPGGSVGTQVSFGLSVAPAGDINDDGYEDVLIGMNGSASRKSPAGVYVLYGVLGLDGNKTLSQVPYNFFSEGNYADSTAASPTPLGDLNHDGFADFAIGAPTFDDSSLNPFASTGVAHVLFGQTYSTQDTLITNATAFTLKDNTNLTSRNRFGQSLVAGDFNGDGKTDIAISNLGAKPAVSFFEFSQIFNLDADYDQDGYTATQGDCQDFFAEIYPDALEKTDRLDNDCDGLADKESPNPEDETPPTTTEPQPTGGTPSEETPPQTGPSEEAERMPITASCQLNTSDLVSKEIRTKD